MTYDGEKWNGAIYKYTGATYFAYYPYDASMNEKTSINAIVTAFKTAVSNQTDQSNYSNYTACDLMTATGDEGVSLDDKTLTFTFTHQMSLIEISLPVQKYKTSNAADAYEYSGPALAKFSITPSGSNATAIKPYNMGSGVYRYIVPAGSSASINGEFKTAGGKTIEYGNTVSALSAGHYKRLNVTYNGAPSTVTERSLVVGDFYYSDGGIVPKDTSSPPKEGCIGVVFWLGDPTKDTDGDPLLGQSGHHPGCTHGLVVALHDANKSLWGADYETVNNWTNSDDRGDNKVNIAEQNRYQGYANTVALKAYNEQHTNKVNSIEAITTTYASAHPTPASSSGWYFPSVMELKYMCWGQGKGSGTAGKGLLDTQFKKVSGDALQSGYYWSSTEDYYNSAWFVYFSNGKVDYDYKDALSCWVRAVVAF